MIPDAAAFSCDVFQSLPRKDSLVTREGLSIFDAASIRAAAARGEMDPLPEAPKIGWGGEGRGGRGGGGKGYRWIGTDAYRLKGMQTDRLTDRYTQREIIVVDRKVG